MALIEERHLVADDEFTRLVLQLFESSLKLLEFLRSCRGFAFHLRASRFFTLSTFQFASNLSQLGQHRLLLLEVFRADVACSLERHMLIEVSQSGLSHLLIDPADSERHVDTDDRRLMAFHHQHRHAVGQFVFDVIDEVLTEGVTSRLYSTLVRDRHLAASVLSDTNYPGVRAPNLFVIAATPLAPHTTAEVEATIYEELDRLKTEPISAKEFERVLNRLDADLVRSLRSNSGLASQLAFYQTVAGNWRYVVNARDRIAAVTPADVQRVASQYLTKSNRTVGVLIKKAPDKTIAAVGKVIQ